MNERRALGMRLNVKVLLNFNDFLNKKTQQRSLRDQLRKD